MWIPFTGSFVAVIFAIGVFLVMMEGKQAAVAVKLAQIGLNAG